MPNVKNRPESGVSSKRYPPPLGHHATALPAARAHDRPNGDPTFRSPRPPTVSMGVPLIFAPISRFVGLARVLPLPRVSPCDLAAVFPLGRWGLA